MLFAFSCPFFARHVFSSILDDLPHLKKHLHNLRPYIEFPNSTVVDGVDVVIGIPTVERKGASYLFRTLQSVLFGLSKNLKYKVVIVVMIATDNEGSEDVQAQILSLYNQFNDYFNSGLLHVIVPPKFWYPNDIHNVESTLGDSPERMYWRTKQNLDYLFLMLFCESLGEYYLQLEDDIITKEGFLTTIMAKVEKLSSQSWFLVEFSSFGFIGKLFRSKDLRYLTQFIALLYRYKPVDWILDTIFYDRYCLPFTPPKNCSRAYKRYRIRGPTLFQHIGLKSSLHGKVQKLKEKTFKETMSFIPHHQNPLANISSNIPHYLNYSFERFYLGFSAFWSSRAPIEGDFLHIEFLQAVPVTGILLRSGNAEHPDDVFDNGTVVRCQQANFADPELLFYFNNDGIAQISFEMAQMLKAVRIEVKSSHDHWAVLSELSIRTSPVTNS